MRMLLDTASLWYRAYFGMPDSLRSPSGMPVHLIRGVLDRTSRLMTTYQPTELIFCLDSDWRPSWRVELIPSYKEHRVETGEGEELVEESMSEQIPILLEILAAFGFAITGAANYEADDVIATLCIEDTIVVTGDRDLFQLVDDKLKIRVAYLAKGVSSHDLVDESYIQNKYGIPGRRYGLFALLRGDASDGLPGVKGIGEKSAAILVNKCESLSDLIRVSRDGDADIKPAIIAKLSSGVDYLERAFPVVSCARNVPLPKLDCKIPKESDLEHILSMKKEFGLGASVDRLIAALGK